MSDSPMRVGVKRTQAGVFAQPESLVELVTAVHGLGFDSFWLGDHIAFPEGMKVKHGREGAWRTDVRQDFLEAIATAGFLLGRVDELPIGIHALIAPYRNPVTVGKSLASLDQLSDGRLRIGLAAGWIEEVFPVVGAPPFRCRGSVLEEYVGVLRAMWRDGVVSFEGEHYDIVPSYVRPVPRGGQGLPILLGGHAPGALRRVGRIADGWAAARLSPREVARSVDVIRQTARAAGRDDAVFEIIVELDLDSDAAIGDDDPEVQELHVDRASLEAYQSAGVTLLLLNPMASTVGQAVTDLTRFRSGAAEFFASGTRRRL
jgi:probable F420-dependent oxidoreductase